MQIVRMSALSRPYLYVPVELTDAGDPVDPSILPVEFALPPAGDDPATGAWVSGTWVRWIDGRWHGRVLVGAGSSLAFTGNRDLWIRVHNEPELLVENCGRVSLD